MLDSPNKLVRDALKEADSDPNYGRVAQAVLDRIDPSDYAYYLLEFIKLRIPNQIANDRNTAIKQVQNYKPSMERPQSEPQTFIEIDAPAPPPVRSAKMDAMRDLALQERVTVGAERKRLGELTYDDLMTIVDDRQARSGQLLASRDMYQAFAQALKQSGKRTLGEIPDEFKKLLNKSFL